MMHGLEMPCAAARIGVKTDQGFRKQTVTFPVTAVVIVARRAEWDVKQTALFIECDGSPCIGMTGSRFGSVFPGLVAVFAFLRNRIELPNAFAGDDIERLNVAGWVIFVHEAIRDSVSKNDKVFVNNWRRCIRVMQLIDGPQKIFSQVDLTALTEA